LFADRIEQRPRDFHDKVRQGYLDLAAREPARHAVIDASKNPDAVWAEVVATLRSVKFG
ncbi:MAG: thymidylate kinase, partial [Planctomycetota bacterium]